MPLRWWIPLPGPVAWVPSRKPKKDPLRHVTDDQWQRIGEGIAGGVQRAGERLDRAGEALERSGERIEAFNARADAAYERTIARHQEIRQLPPWPRFKAAFGFPPRQR